MGRRNDYLLRPKLITLLFTLNKKKSLFHHGKNSFFCWCAEGDLTFHATHIYKELIFKNLQILKISEYRYF